MNSTLEIVNQVTENLVHTSYLNNIYLYKDDPLAGTIEVTDFLSYIRIIQCYKPDGVWELHAIKCPIHF